MARQSPHKPLQCSGLLAVALLATMAASASAAAAADTARPAESPAAATSESTTPAWIRPEGDRKSIPLWGHPEGLRVGLAPLPGPRGLLRIYTPYLGQKEQKSINYIAVEPIRAGEVHRGLSELELSRLDGRRGKRFWSRNDLDDLTPQSPDNPAAGWLETIDGVECLRVYILVERFRNGAHVYLRLTFRADEPYEVGVATFAHEDSAPLAHCIVTATMGNYARLRRLELADRSVLAGELWPDYQEDGFAPHARFPLAELRRTPAGHAVARATPTEPNPADAEYAPGTRPGWRYEGGLAAQSWRCESPPPGLEVLVNGRVAYWASQSPIPGGISYENFEMVAPFRQGEEFWFRVEPLAETSDAAKK